MNGRPRTTVRAETTDPALVGARLDENERRRVGNDGWRNIGCVGNLEFSAG